MQRIKTFRVTLFLFSGVSTQHKVELETERVIRGNVLVVIKADCGTRRISTFNMIPLGANQ
jgi:hypothetical protein